VRCGGEGRYPLKWFLGPAIFAALLAGCGVSNALEPPNSQTNTGSGKLLVGEHMYVGFPIDVRADRSCDAHVTAARIIGADAGLTTVVRAVDRDDGSQSGIIGEANDADLQQTEPGIRLHPVSDAVFVPGRDQRWYLLGAASARRPGVFHTRGLQVGYTCGGQPGSELYLYAMTLNATAAADPGPSSQPSP
jgi:hypothetical protein